MLPERESRPTPARVTRPKISTAIKTEAKSTSGRRGSWVITHRAPLVLICGMAARDRLRQYGFSPTWTELGRGWLVEDVHLPDLAAIADLVTNKYRVIHDDGSDCQHGASLRGERREVDVDPSDVT